MVELLNIENGRKFTLKTDAKGNYYLMGVLPGNNYKITIFALDGKTVLWFANGLPMARHRRNRLRFRHQEGEGSCAEFSRKRRGSQEV